MRDFKTSFAMKKMCNRNVRSVVVDVNKMSYESVLILTLMCGSGNRNLGVKQAPFEKNQMF